MKIKLQIRVVSITILEVCRIITSTDWTINIMMEKVSWYRPFLIIMASYVSLIDIESSFKWSINDVIEFWIIKIMTSSIGKYSEIFKFIITVILSTPTIVRHPKVRIICLPLWHGSVTVWYFDWSIGWEISGFCVLSFCQNERI